MGDLALLQLGLVPQGDAVGSCRGQEQTVGLLQRLSLQKEGLGRMKQQNWALLSYVVFLGSPNLSSS